jgi:hypothetical protein
MHRPSIGRVIIVQDLSGVCNPAIVHAASDQVGPSGCRAVDATVFRLGNQPHPVFGCPFFDTKSEAHAWLDQNERRHVVAFWPERI